VAAALALTVHQCAAEVVQTFAVKDCLNHAWQDELVHFDFDVPATADRLVILDAADTPLPCQFTDVVRDAQTGRTTGRAWTVVSVGPRQEVILRLASGGESPPSDLTLTEAGGLLLVRNRHLTVAVPSFAEGLAGPVKLTALAAPVVWLAGPEGAPSLGSGAWVNEGPPVTVAAASTEVIERGPVRVTVRYRMAFADGGFYQAEIVLGSRQECASFTDQTDVAAPRTAFRFSFEPGLKADRLLWRNNYYAEPAKGLAPGPLDFETEQVVCKLCPWAFWWLKDQTSYAGFFREGSEPLAGVIAVRPSRWTPVDWAGFERTAIPITVRPGGRLDITLPLLALPAAAGGTPPTPAHRELMFTVGTVSAHMPPDKSAAKLRLQLLKHSEFPLDEVKDYGFDFRRAGAARRHPFLLFTQADIERARRQAVTVPTRKADLEKATTYLGRLGCNPVEKIRNGPDGWRRFFVENYVGNGLYDVAPLAFLGSADEAYSIILSAGVKGLAGQHLDMFLNAPSRATLGGNAHMSGTTLLRLLAAYDALADTDLLSDAEKADIEAALVFGGYVYDHPDYWNGEVGLCSANPNMTSLLKLPLGVLALFLDGHPRAPRWLAVAEAELERELREWIAPGGAWIECPMYQAPSLDGIFLLAQALKNVKGRDLFSAPRLQATMDYYGFILTPPDLRSPARLADSPGPMTVPSIGDAFPNFTHPYNGWIAKATAQSDPAFSARQQFYWKGQAFSCLNGGRAGFIPALCDSDLPAVPPAELARAFEGFGSVMRTSWTDPKASYVAHRNGYFLHHYDPGDANSIVYYAKGAPLCMDFGHRGASHDEVITMYKPDYHNTVSFDLAASERHWGMSGGTVEASRQAQEVRSLPRTIGYSAGLSVGGGNQANTRHVVLVKSDDSLGATYLVMRDVTRDGQPGQEFFWNLWCMAGEPEVAGRSVHFPGLFGVDLDVHMLSPAGPQFVKDAYRYEQWVNPWGNFTESQTGIHVRKQGSSEDFLAVLFPRVAGQGEARVSVLADGAGCRVEHFEGTDLLLLSPGRPAAAEDGDARVEGEIALVSRHADGTVRLAVVRGPGVAKSAKWGLSSDGPTAIAVAGMQAEGESSGAAHTAIVELPPGLTAAVRLDGQPLALKAEGARLTLPLPVGHHRFTIAAP